jgi:hypothetical protein
MKVLVYSNFRRIFFEKNETSKLNEEWNISPFQVQGCQNGRPSSSKRPHPTSGCQCPVHFTPRMRLYMQMELRIRTNAVLSTDGNLFTRTQSFVRTDVELHPHGYNPSAQIPFDRTNYHSICWGPQLVLLGAPINSFGMKFERYDLYKYLFYLCFTFISFSYIYFKLKVIHEYSFILRFVRKICKISQDRIETLPKNKLLK